MTDTYWTFADNADGYVPCVDCKNLLVFSDNTTDGRCMACHAEATHDCIECGKPTTNARLCNTCWLYDEL